jgi:hypothetical protein
LRPKKQRPTSNTQHPKIKGAIIGKLVDRGGFRQGDELDIQEGRTLCAVDVVFFLHSLADFCMYSTMHQAVLCDILKRSMMGHLHGRKTERETKSHE